MCRIAQTELIVLRLQVHVLALYAAVRANAKLRTLGTRDHTFVRRRHICRSVGPDRRRLRASSRARDWHR